MSGSYYDNSSLISWMLSKLEGAAELDFVKFLVLPSASKTFKT
jgi:hypothetical protein